MRNVWLVARREFVTRGRNRAYLLSSLFTAGFPLLILVVSSIFAASETMRPQALHILDRTGQVAGPLRAELEHAAPVPMTVLAVAGDEGALAEEARRSGAALLVVEGTFPHDVRVRYMAESQRLLEGSAAVTDPLQSLINAARLRARGLDPVPVLEAVRPVPVQSLQVTGRGRHDGKGAMVTAYLALGMVLSLQTVVMTNGYLVAQGVLEEKVSRVMEVMVSAVGPQALLRGKLIGLGALGLIQFLAVLGVWGGLIAVSAGLVGTTISTVGLGTVAVCLTFLALGYTLSTILMAAIASTVSRIEDSHVVTSPMSGLMTLPLVASSVLLQDMQSSAAVVLSMVPGFSPVLMVMRLLLTDVPAWQVVTALTLMAFTTAAGVWAGGRVYRAALLSYGGRPTVRQMLQYLRLG